jgi:(4S)-4-hydroxy-5-phosphonooxypentane-2,3-dione isomerase
MLVVTVRFELGEGAFEPFRAAILKNAAASLDGEPGCHRFDVTFSEDRRRCFLYEQYTDAAAFEAHQRTDHFLEFGRASQPYVKAKQLEVYRLEPNPLAKRRVT